MSLFNKYLVLYGFLIVLLETSCQRQECSEIPEGVPYKIIDRGNQNLLPLYTQQDIRVFSLSGDDTLELAFDILRAVDGTHFLYVRAVPAPHSEGQGFFLKIKNLPVDTLFVSTEKRRQGRCRAWMYDQVLCNGGECPRDINSLCVFYLIRK